MRKNNETIPEQDSGIFNLSISDLMAGLLSIFILALCFVILNFTQRTSRLVQNDQLREDLIVDLYDKIDGMKITVDKDKERGILRIPEDTLAFVKGSADVPNREKVIKIGHAILEVLNDDKYKGKVETVFIEGHTDNDSISTYRFPSNWELSTQRAINVWNVMRSGPNGELSELTCVVRYRDENKNIKEVIEPLFSCSGYAETRPIAPNDIETNKSKNRRIDIRFTMVPPVAEDSGIVKKVKEKLKGE